MGIPDHLFCLLRNLYAGQEATVRTGHGKTDCFQIGKGVHQGCIAYLTFMQSTSCEMLGWMNHKLESRLPGEISVASDMQITSPLWQKAKRKMPNRRETSRSRDRCYFLWLQNHCEQWLQPWNRKMLALWKNSMANLDSIFKTRDVTLLATFHRVKGMVFPVVMHECESNHKEGWQLKNKCFRTMVLEKTR